MKQLEYGVTRWVNVGVDLSTATDMVVTFTRPNKSTFTKTTTLVTSNTEFSDGVTLEANKHIRFDWADGDLTLYGDYVGQFSCKIGSAQRIGDKFTINVDSSLLAGCK